MAYLIRYSCQTDIGKVRTANQDNFACNGSYLSEDSNLCSSSFISGTVHNSRPSLFGVFDGMGGEERGEIASLIAAKVASEKSIGKHPEKDLLDICNIANTEVCDYAKKNGVYSMGTTAALLAFSRHCITMCNIGDSKVFKIKSGKMTQISADHYAASAFGTKPPLSQNIGIPSNEMIIEPCIVNEHYCDGDVFLICSDGLTDMIGNHEICDIIIRTPLGNIANTLIDAALENGGRDNITVIVCKVERKRGCLFRKSTN